jgi:tetratricopeptide (TPR) repeat protein
VRDAIARAEMAEAQRAHASLLVRLHTATGRCLHEEGVLREAAAAYTAALLELRGPAMREPGTAHGATVASLLHLRACAAYARGQHAEAEVDARAALAPELLLGEAEEDAPLCAQLQQLLGLSLAQRGELWGGVAALSAAIASQPHYADALLQRGTLLLICERPDAAVQDLTRALRLQPGWPLALRARGYALAASHDFDAAAADLEEAGRAEPSLRANYLHVPYERLTVDAVDMEWRAGSRQLRLKRPCAERDFDEHVPEAAEAVAEGEDEAAVQDGEDEAVEHAESAEVPGVDEGAHGVDEDGYHAVRTEAVAPTMYLPTAHVPRRPPGRRQIF